jgi:hypothetical protein
MSRKRTILKESQHVTSPNANTPIRPQDVGTIADRRRSKDAANSRNEANYGNDFFIGHKLIMIDIVPKGSKFNQPYFINYIFPDLNGENVNLIVGFPRRLLDTYGQFSVTMDQKWHQNSRSTKFHDDNTHPIRQP